MRVTRIFFQIIGHVSVSCICNFRYEAVRMRRHTASHLQISSHDALHSLWDARPRFTTHSRMFHPRRVHLFHVLSSEQVADKMTLTRHAHRRCSICAFGHRQTRSPTFRDFETLAPGRALPCPCIQCCRTTTTMLHRHQQD